MSGKLYVVGTPIGNLEDMSVRAVKTLQEVDFIAAEDTRVTLKLLSHFEIKKPMVSYHEHNAREKGGEIITRLLSGQTCAIVTDAGMPCISDPGEDLVRLCAENGIDTVVIPGPSAAISALALSGLSTSKFVFEGFLNPQKNARLERLEELKREKRTIIFYEAPHKLCDTLSAMYQVLGDRKITLARELTKIYEEVIRTTLSQAVALFEEKAPKGEFVLVVEGMVEEEQSLTFEQALELIQALVDKGEPLSKAAKDVARQTGFKKGELYSRFLAE
ncbi:16S rRNA (cytidine(1402)-2'-O)-methyltransferase [Negativibacillus massiliensis]|uniref:16S rRNA (cytidine(1402)-2'-O)-methyltransferase n=1 Tax=Negativibacillus massiliensis TaxID=1871035 RepID=UPI0023F7836D|nr:16S rRNA (cytidine(1402)-2'-O)-methyltransferase [Negativibacillus massiliensis]